MLKVKELVLKKKNMNPKMKTDLKSSGLGYPSCIKQENRGTVMFILGEDSGRYLRRLGFKK